MFRMWGKLYRENRLLADSMICNDDPNTTRTKKVFDALNTLCYDFDLSVPIWLDSNIQEFKRISKTRFSKDNFVETIDFDYFEIQVVEEDDMY
ncbi:MAG: hypothetical protein ACLRZ7_05880 [Lachnospiraceae bacterium]